MQADVIVKPSAEPISMELAWAHLAIDTDGSPPESPFDLWLEKVGIPGARGAAENFTGLSFAPKTYRLMIDGFPSGALNLPMPPVTNIVSVVYADPSGVEQVLPPGAYYLDDRHSDAWLMPAHGTSWPQTLVAPNSVTVTYVSGFTQEKLPEEALWAMLLLLGHAFKNREAITDRQAFEMPIGIDYILRPLRVNLGMA